MSKINIIINKKYKKVNILFLLFIHQSVFFKCFADGNCDLSVVAGENIVNKFLLGLTGDKADYGNDHKRCKHCECAAVDRALKKRREA